MRELLVRLGSTNPELRPHIRPVLAELEKSAGEVDTRKILPDIVRLVKDELRSLGLDNTVLVGKRRTHQLKSFPWMQFPEDPISLTVPALGKYGDFFVVKFISDTYGEGINIGSVLEWNRAGEGEPVLSKGRLFPKTVHSVVQFVYDRAKENGFFDQAPVDPEDVFTEEDFPAFPTPAAPAPRQIPNLDSSGYRVFNDQGLEHMSEEGHRALKRVVKNLRRLTSSWDLDQGQVVVRGPDHPDAMSKDVELLFYHEGRVEDPGDMDALARNIQDELAPLLRLPEFVSQDGDQGEGDGRMELYDFIYLKPM